MEGSEIERTQENLQGRADALRRKGQPFVIATVVRTLNATSAKPGDKALIGADGTILNGWVGGGCIRSAVGKAACEAVEDGQTRFLSLRPEDLLDAEGVTSGEERDGVRFARNGCPSKGSMDIFVEPVLPQPLLQICGSGPVAIALAALAREFDFDVSLAAPGLSVSEVPEGAVASDGFVFDTEQSSTRFTVIATQGKGDEAALRAAVAAGADYISFVGSHRKFSTLSERLTSDGVDSAALATVKAPAGLDIQAITPKEIALSILAEITQHRRSKQRPEAAL